MVEAKTSFDSEKRVGGLWVWLRKLTPYDLVRGSYSLDEEDIVADVIWFEPKGLSYRRLVNGLEDLKRFISHVNSGEYGYRSPTYIAGFVGKNVAKLASRVGFDIAQINQEEYQISAKIQEISEKIAEIEGSKTLKQIKERLSRRLNSNV